MRITITIVITVIIIEQRGLCAYNTMSDVHYVNHNLVHILLFLIFFYLYVKFQLLPNGCNTYVIFIRKTCWKLIKLKSMLKFLDYAHV